jgi:hypothetical protein
MLRIHRKFSVIAPALVAFLITVLILIPGSAWHHPANDQTYVGFDSNLVYRSGMGDGEADGAVTISGSALEIDAVPFSEPTANLLTTPLKRLVVSLDVIVVKNSPASNPLRLGLWTPTGGSGYFINFGPAPANLITADTTESGFPGHTLQAGDRVTRGSLGSYHLGQPSRVTLALEKETGNVRATLSSGLDVRRSEVSAAVLPRLFESVRISLTASATASSGNSSVRLESYRLTLPHEQFWANKADDTRAVLALIGLGALGGILLLVAIVKWVRQRAVAGALRVLDRKRRQLLSALTHQRRLITIVAGVLLLGYLLPNALLFALGGHPFDMANEKLYAYVAARAGPAQLYYLPNLVSFPAIWNGVPYNEAAFPYEPALAYVFTAIGWFARLVLGSSSFTPASGPLEYIIKAVNVAFGLADAVVIYLILRALRVGYRWSLAGALMFLLNPAVWFSMSVWGQNHVISIFFTLAAILYAQRDHPVAAWMFLAAAALTRPQMLVVTLLIGIALLRKFPLRLNVLAVSWTVIAVFVLLLPFTLPTSPSVPVDIMANTFFVQEGGGNDPGLTTVSQDAYSIWPLVTYLKYGTSGLYRSFLPSSQSLWGSLSYQRAGLVATGITLAVVSVLLLRRRRPDLDGGAYLPLVALGFVAFLMFMTGLVATHFLLALPVLILCRPWMGIASYLSVIAGWTVTTLVPMYGDMGNVVSRLNYPLLSREHNGITRFFVALYSWDRFITFATLVNMCILVSIAVVALRSRRRPDLPIGGRIIAAA